MIESPQKNILSDQIQIKRPRKLVNSENLERYKDIMGSFSIDKDFVLILSQHNITYTPSSPFQVFSFEVQQMIPASDFFKLNIKMAHFSLSITALRHYQQKKSDDQIKSPGIFGNISFSQFNNRCLCLKSFYFSQEQFQFQFQRMIKQFTILKISSALECGPYLENYMGFDIIIYDNCIQYATEKGQPIQIFTKRDQQHLQQQLTLLHSLKIIHYDIKPENIVFCHTYDKPVFIDFGLSQIVEQPLGLKTYGSFRGTPNYCSTQIFDLMMKEEDYADLYYNDAFCLSVTIKQQEIYQNQPMYKDIEYLIPPNTHPQLFLFLFKYHYLNEKISEGEISLQSYLQQGGNIRTIFEFVKQVFRYIFILPKFQKALSKYKNSFLYQEILQKHKFVNEKIFFQSTIDDELEVLQSHKQFIPLSFFPSKQDVEGLIGNNNRKNYLQFFQVLLKITVFEEKTVWHYLSLVFSCVRFDVQNLSLEQKNLIAKKISPILAVYRGKQVLQWYKQTQGTSELQQIKQLLKSISEFCLQSKPNIWSKQNLIDIFEQLIILDVNLSEYVDRFLKFFQQQASSPLEQLQFALQCSRLESATGLVFSEQMESTQILRRKNGQFIKKTKEKFKQYASSSTDQSFASIVAILEMFQSDDYIPCQRLISGQNNLLNKIDHPKIRKILFYSAAIRHIHSSQIILKSDFAISKIMQLKRYWQSRKLPLFSWLESTIRLMKIASSDAELRLFFKQVKKIINCQQIMDNHLLYSGWILRKSNQTIMRQMIKKLLRSYPKLGKLNKQADFILHQIILEITQGIISIDEKLSQQFHQIYSYYEKYHMKFIQQSDPVHYEITHRCSELFMNAEIQSFFYALSPLTQGILRFKLEKAENTIKSIQNSNIINYINGVLYFQCFLYQLLYFKLQNRLIQCIDTSYQFFTYCRYLCQQKLALQILARINKLACQSKVLNLIIYSTKELYSYCLQKSYLFLYLLPYHVSETFIALAVFAQEDQHKFYEFLGKLLQLLNINPIDSYIASLLAAIDKFLQKDPHHSYLIHFNKLETIFPRILKNPYFLIFYMYSLGDQSNNLNKLAILKMISIHINKLSTFAKGKILSKYFLVYLRFLRDKKFQQYLFNFRKAKIYLKQERVIYETKRIFRNSKGFKEVIYIGNAIKKKVQNIIENMKNENLVK